MGRVANLTKVTSHLQHKLKTQAEEVVKASIRLSKTMEEVEAFQKTLLEMETSPRTNKVLNRHQITKRCRYCNEFKDPRGLRKHEQACKRKTKALRAA